MNSYLPYEAKVVKTKKLSSDSRMLRIKFKDPDVAESFVFIPGQFIELSLFGFGEVPVGIASSPENKEYIEVSIRKVGNVTGAVHDLEVGDPVGVRGPFGNGFTDSMVRDKDVLIISGGCGIPPMRALIFDVMNNRKKYGHVDLLYGARTQNDLLFSQEYTEWKNHKIKIHLTVDSADHPDKALELGCGVGVVTNLLDKIKITDKTVAVMCGPPIMYKFVIQKLLKMGLDASKIYVSLERRMKCGVGKCQHCTSGSKYVCLDGPVFSYSQILSEYGGL